MTNEVTIRLSIFIGLFILLACAEHLLPRRKRIQTRGSRWFTNIGLTVINSITIRFMAIILPVLAVAAAADAHGRGWGLLGAVDWPNWVEIIIAMLVLDFIIWAQHLTGLCS